MAWMERERARLRVVDTRTRSLFCSFSSSRLQGVLSLFFRHGDWAQSVREMDGETEREREGWRGAGRERNALFPPDFSSLSARRVSLTRLHSTHTTKSRVLHSARPQARVRARVTRLIASASSSFFFPKFDTMGRPVRAAASAAAFLFLALCARLATAGPIMAVDLGGEFMKVRRKERKARLSAPARCFFFRL